MSALNAEYRHHGGKSERVGAQDHSLLDAKVPDWRNKV